MSIDPIHLFFIAISNSSKREMIITFLLCSVRVLVVVSAVCQSVMFFLLTKLLTTCNFFYAQIDKILSTN